MLAAIISLLLVILFVLLLHIYAKWFLQHRRRTAAAATRRRTRRSATAGENNSISNFLHPNGHFHHFHNYHSENITSPSKGLESSTIALIPLFIHTHSDNNPLECVVCLSVFEDNEVGRCLPKCGHSFHAECIDMWLHSHTNCPICRAPVVPEKSPSIEVNDNSVSNDAVERGTELVEIVVAVDQQQQGNSRESNCEMDEQIPDVGLLNHESHLSSSSSSPSSSSGSGSLLGCSFKRMLSRNSRSDHPSRIFPSGNANAELGD